MNSQLNRRTSGVGRAIAFVLATLGASSSARADPSAADIDSARALYKEARQLRAQGQLEASLEKFRSAHAIAATPITALDLGRAYALVGKLIEAREAFLSIERLPVRPDESEKATYSRKEGRHLAEGLTARLASVAFEFTPTPTAAPHLTIDGETVPPEAQASPRKVNPGAHIIVAELGPARAHAEVTLAEGEARTVTLALNPPPNTAPETSQRAPIPGELTPELHSKASPFVYIGLATAGAGILVGTITGIVAFSKASSVKSVCPNERCPPPAHDDLDTSKSMGTVSTIAFAAAGAGAAITIAGLFLGKTHSASTTGSTRWVSPYVGPGSMGVSGSF